MQNEVNRTTDRTASNGEEMSRNITLVYWQYQVRYGHWGSLNVAAFSRKKDAEKFIKDNQDKKKYRSGHLCINKIPFYKGE